MTDLLLFWHRRDLRLEDNQGLAMACDRSPQVVGVFCFDPQILQADDLAPARLAYLVGCLTALQQSYRARGGGPAVPLGRSNPADCRSGPSPGGYRRLLEPGWGTLCPPARPNRSDSPEDSRDRGPGRLLGPVAASPRGDL